ncbi:MAG: FAD-dependent oxidoreductase [Sediminicola sp.]
MTKRREFMKAIGLGSGSFLMSPITVFGHYGEDNIAVHGKSALTAPIAAPQNTDAYTIKEYDTDILIAGGGMAGLCAAIAAARNGSKVVLLQDRSRLGGNASSEIRMHISGASQLKQVWRETGILEELVLTEAVENPQRSYEMWDYILYDKVVSEKNITLLLDTAMYDTEVVDGQIKKVWAICSPTEEISIIKAKFFADCTGDSTLAAKAGALYMRGREAKSKWGESLAVDVADQKTMGNSLLFMAQEFDKKMPYTPPTWARKYTTKDFIHRGIANYEYGYWWLELGGEIDIIRDGQQNRHDLLSVLFGIWDYIKNSGNHPDSANWALSWVGMIPGKRESRRMEGDYIMKQKDVQSATLFEDRVAYGGWPLDDHPPGGMDTTGDVPYVSIQIKEPYSIPLRSLYSKNIGNLFAAGRNISVSHVALSSTRVMATCSTLGQAIGTAMAYCGQHGLLPAGLIRDKGHLKSLQQILLAQDQSLLGVKNEDGQDLARTSKVVASSQTDDGAAGNIIDGWNRDINDGKTHQWRATMADGEQWIELKWDSDVKINKIQITFDTGAQRFLRISGQDAVYDQQVRGPQPETVADYIIEGKGKKFKDIIATNNNNYLRMVKHEFATVALNSIRLIVKRTNGDPLAKIFEIRCYQEKRTV